MNLFKILVGLAFVSTVGVSSYGADEKAIILDVRTPDEYVQSHIEGALNIDFLNSNFKAEAEKLDHTKKYVVYCRSGNRSRQAVKVLKELDFKYLTDLGSATNAAEALKLKCVGKTDKCI